MSTIAFPYPSEPGTVKKISLYGAMINGAAGGIVSNIDDMSKWMLVQLNKGKYGANLEKQLFTKER